MSAKPGIIFKVEMSDVRLIELYGTANSCQHIIPEYMILFTHERRFEAFEPYFHEHDTECHVVLRPDIQYFGML